MRASPTAPRVTIVLATDSYDTLRPVIASLGQQPDRADFEVLVIGTAEEPRRDRLVAVERLRRGPRRTRACAIFAGRRPRRRRSGRLGADRLYRRNPQFPAAPGC